MAVVIAVAAAAVAATASTAAIAPLGKRALTFAYKLIEIHPHPPANRQNTDQKIFMSDKSIADKSD